MKPKKRKVSEKSDNDDAKCGTHNSGPGDLDDDVLRVDYLGLASLADVDLHFPIPNQRLHLLSTRIGEFGLVVVRVGYGVGVDLRGSLHHRFDEVGSGVHCGRTR